MAEQEKDFKISFTSQINKYNDKILAKNRNDFKNVNSSRVSFAIPNNYQLFSLGSSFVPFFHHNDANRTLMGIGMQKQALILQNRETAIVNAGALKNFIGNNFFSFNSLYSGSTRFISDKKIFLRSFLYLQTVKVSNKVLWRKFCLSLKLKRFDYRSKQKVYLCSTPTILGKNFPMFFSRTKKRKNRVNMFENLKGENIKNSLKLAIGRNLFLCYMSWKGYNFEDAIVVNESLIHKDLFTCLCVKKNIVFLTNGPLGSVLI